MRVFVMNMRGEPLMPTTCRKARILLKEKKARIYCYEPFTIQLLYPTGEAKQQCNIGIDTGAKHIGIAITSENKIVWKGEVELRDDVKENITARRILRRSRRNRKTRYRAARWQNRTKPEGWLPPSIQSRIDNTFNWIDKFQKLVPNPQLHIEVGKFNVAKMINPDIQGKEYQQGQMYGYGGIKTFVKSRDNYTCQCCGAKLPGSELEVHHIKFRSKGGSDRPNNLITVCKRCHTTEAHLPGGILYDWMQKSKTVKEYKEIPFMNSLRLRIINRYSEADITYGIITYDNREALCLDKTHYNDAIAISGIKFIKENSDNWILIKQYRKKKRSLHESIPRKGRKEPNRTQKRNNKNTPQRFGFFLGETVRVLGKIGRITGFDSVGAYVKDYDEQYIHIENYSGYTVPKRFLVHEYYNNGWQFIPRS